VPLSGEVMASRWAFEALAVNQFKNNKYEKNFYKFHKSISIAEYKKDYWIQKVESKITKIDNALKEGKTLPEMKDDITLLHNEILKESTLNAKIKTEIYKQINTKDYNNDVVNEIKDYFKNLREYYINVGNTARAKLDYVNVSMQKTAEDRKNYSNLKAHCDNENLNSLVKNSTELNRCIEKDGKLIQQIDPIFEDPTDSKLGRAHFFAPRKNFLGTLYSTYWFNICVIWLMTVVLIITLYFDVFKKVLDGLGGLASLVGKKR
jgi:hypothetical protein